MTNREGRISHSKEGNVESAADALALVEWLASKLLDEYEDSFGHGFHVDIEVSVKPRHGGYNDE